MTFFTISQNLSNELDSLGLRDVLDCSVCRGFTKVNLIQLHELANTCQICAGCFFLQGIFDTIQDLFNLPSRPGTPLLFTSLDFWGPEHFLTLARCSVERLGPYSVQKISKAADFFEIFTLPGERCPWPKVPSAKVLSSYTGCPASLYQLNSWLSSCVQNHKYCGYTDEVDLPARLLKISGNDDSDPKVQLIDTNGAKGRYICLSHRWFSGQAITTTTSNIDERKAGIHWDDLPKTFREVIKVTQDLGFEYLWIDSLCINQDPSSGDWLIEAPKMAQYYQNAFLTISATEATEGLFYKRPKGAQIMWEVVAPENFKQRWEPYNICIREPLSHDASALHGRGWVLQEHVLSPRVIHFGKELIWECTELTACQCGRLPLPTDYGQIPLADISSIGHLINAYDHKGGHTLALEFLRPATRFYVEPQAVYAKPEHTTLKDAEEIIRYLLIQKKVIESSETTTHPQDFERADHPNNVPTHVLPPNGVDRFIPKIIFLQSSGIKKEAEETTRRALGKRGQEIENTPNTETTEPPTHITVYPTPLLHSRWLDIVAHYTRRKLTFGNDILPALAGLAKQFHSKFCCDYYAGLWKTSMVMDLLWRSRNPQKHPKQPGWIAPSWSWASTTAAVDYYHLLMWFELDTHTFRYVVSDIFVSDIMVECVPLEGCDMTMHLRSAKMMLKGPIFQVKLPKKNKWQEDRDEGDEGDDDFRDLSLEEIEAKRKFMESAILLPNVDIPDDDIRFFPLASMCTKETVMSLVADTKQSFIEEKNLKMVIRPFIEFWPDNKFDLEELSETQQVDCVLVAKHMSAMDRCYFSLVLKPTDESATFERIGLLRHKDLLCGTEASSLIKIV
jgi:Heterokaryon incompatibility protein (HET)